MSTIGSNSEDLILNADGGSSTIKLKINGTEKASVSSAGVFTSTTIDATALTGNLPAISGASLTNIPAANITGTLPAISAANLTSVPAANITGTLPAIDGSNLTGVSGGKVLQVVQGSAKTTVSSTSSTTLAATGLTANITTTETNSKILVNASVNGLEKDNLNTYGKLVLYRGTTSVFAWEAWVGYGLVMAYYPGSGALGSSSVTYLDSPTHTANDTLTYNVYFKANSGTFKVNVAPSQSIIVLSEIGA